MATEPILYPASLPTQELLAELDRRAAAHRDRPSGTSDQICPNCSTTDKEVLGLWHRSTSRFHCEACKVKLQGNGYEYRLEQFFTRRWRERKAKRDLEGAAREMSRMLR